MWGPTAKDRVWLDDDQGISPARPEAREKDPDEPVPLCETRSGFTTLVDGELVAQGGDLQEKVDARSE